ncbi:MAG: MBL fold metallo-hydrolase [Chloroflexi bacterium]|nr:MBL fold metallo-hydrolase [Chloroflexota bacterium]
MNSTENYHFQVGTLNCIAIHDGAGVSPVESLTKNVPPEQVSQALRERGYSPTEIALGYNCLTIQADRCRVLVDAGWGQEPQGPRQGELLQRLQADGITPDDIDLVVITHGDYDHIAGITTPDNRLTFPHAEYVLLKESWDFHSDRAILAQLPRPMQAFGGRTLPLIRERLKIVAANAEFLPGFHLLSAAGHRPGHSVLHIESGGECLLHLADAVGHPILMEHPTWQWSYDSMPDQAAEVRTSLLQQAASQHAVVFGSHFPFPGVGRVTREEAGWRWHPAVMAA